MSKSNQLLNGLIVLLLILILLLMLVNYKYAKLTTTLEDMCFYDYPDDYICSCDSPKQYIDVNLSNLSYFDKS